MRSLLPSLPLSTKVCSRSHWASWYLRTLGQPHRRKNPPRLLPPAKPRLRRNPSRSLRRNRRNPSPRKKRTLTTTPMKIPMKVSPKHSRWLLRRRPRRPRGEPKSAKLPLLPGVRIIYGAPFAVFSGTSIPERRSFWIRWVFAIALAAERTFVDTPPDQANERSGG